MELFYGHKLLHCRSMVGVYLTLFAIDIHVLLLVMAALRSRCGHYIFALWFVTAALCDRAGHIYFHPVLSSFFLLSFFFSSPIISAVGDWMSTILPHMMWP